MADKMKYYKSTTSVEQKSVDTSDVVGALLEYLGLQITHSYTGGLVIFGETDAGHIQRVRNDIRSLGSVVAEHRNAINVLREGKADKRVTKPRGS